jgi:hypothetical protein
MGSLNIKQPGGAGDDGYDELVEEAVDDDEAPDAGLTEEGSLLSVDVEEARQSRRRGRDGRGSGAGSEIGDSRGDGDEDGNDDEDDDDDDDPLRERNATLNRSIQEMRRDNLLVLTANDVSDDEDEQVVVHGTGAKRDHSGTQKGTATDDSKQQLVEELLGYLTVGKTDRSRQARQTAQSRESGKTRRGASTTSPSRSQSRSTSYSHPMTDVAADDQDASDYDDDNASEADSERHASATPSGWVGSVARAVRSSIHRPRAMDIAWNEDEVLSPSEQFERQIEAGHWQDPNGFAPENGTLEYDQISRQNLWYTWLVACSVHRMMAARGYERWACRPKAWKGRPLDLPPPEVFARPFDAEAFDYFRRVTTGDPRHGLMPQVRECVRIWWRRIPKQGLESRKRRMRILTVLYKHPTTTMKSMYAFLKDLIHTPGCHHAVVCLFREPKSHKVWDLLSTFQPGPMGLAVDKLRVETFVDGDLLLWSMPVTTMDRYELMFTAEEREAAEREAVNGQLASRRARMQVHRSERLHSFTKDVEMGAPRIKPSSILARFHDWKEGDVIQRSSPFGGSELCVVGAVAGRGGDVDGEDWPDNDPDS